MKCPKCRTVNPVGATECENCAVQFGDLRRRETPAGPGRNGQTCAWDDHGRRCVCRGILSSATDGGGSWYCREHWERVNGREADVTGNAQPTQRGQSMAAEGWRKAMADYRAAGGRSILDAKPALPGYTVGREPGDDDDYADLVPDEMGQA